MAYMTNTTGSDFSMEMAQAVFSNVPCLQVGGWVNQAYSRLSTTHGHITDCKLYSVVYAGVCMVIFRGYRSQTFTIKLTRCAAPSLVWKRIVTRTTRPSHRTSTQARQGHQVAECRPSSRIPPVSSMSTLRIHTHSCRICQPWQVRQKNG